MFLHCAIEPFNPTFSLCLHQNQMIGYWILEANSMAVLLGQAQGWGDGHNVVLFQPCSQTQVVMTKTEVPLNSANSQSHRNRCVEHVPIKLKIWTISCEHFISTVQLYQNSMCVCRVLHLRVFTNVHRKLNCGDVIRVNYGPSDYPRVTNAAKNMSAAAGCYLLLTK